MRDGHSAFDFDPEAIAWARAKVERLSARIEKHATWLDDAGRSDEATGLRRALYFIDRDVLGGSGCVIGSLDDRLPSMSDILSRDTA